MFSAQQAKIACINKQNEMNESYDIKSMNTIPISNIPIHDVEEQIYNESRNNGMDWTMFPDKLSNDILGKLKDNGYQVFLNKCTIKAILPTIKGYDFIPQVNYATIVCWNSIPDLGDEMIEL